jgi:hypothetical protein
MMNKAEKLEMESLKVQLALRWHPEVLPDMQPPTNVGVIVHGYTVEGGRVVPACTAFGSWGTGDKTNRQHARALYSTPELAHRALMHGVAKQAAHELHRLDVRLALGDFIP